MMNQLMPFNEHQFDRCMSWFSWRYKLGLDQFQMVKLHVLTDVFHVLASGMPVMGGALERWPHGPVVKAAYFRVARWKHRYNEGLEDSPFEIAPVTETVYSFKAREAPDPDSFSDAEVQAMQQAWDTLAGKSFGDAQEFFHDPRTFIGKAWSEASRNGGTVDWLTLIDAYDRQMGTDHSHIKEILCACVR